MNTIEEHADFPLPAADVYAQFTQFESMPTFLRDVEAVRQIDDTRLHMDFTSLGQTESFDAVITEQVPDKRIAWTSSSSPKVSGCLTFHRLDANHSRVMVQVGIEEGAGVVEKVRSALAANLRDFSNFLQRRGKPTGRWEGAVPAPGEDEHGDT